MMPVPSYDIPREEVEARSIPMLTPEQVASYEPKKYIFRDMYNLLEKYQILLNKKSLILDPQREAARKALEFQHEAARQTLELFSNALEFDARLKVLNKEKYPEFGPGTSPIEVMLKLWWRTEVNRAYLVIDPKTGYERWQQASLKPIDPMLSGQDGVFADVHLLRKRVAVAEFATKFLFYKLQLGIHSRRDPSLEGYGGREVGDTCAPLPKKEKYSIILSFPPQVKKIFITYAEANDFGLLSQVITDALKRGDETWQEQTFDPELYAKAKAGEITIEQGQQDADDKNNFHAADFYLSFQNEAALNSLQKIHTNADLINYGSNIPQVIGLGIDDNQQVSTVAVNALHSVTDGAPLKFENETAITSVTRTPDVIRGRTPYIPTQDTYRRIYETKQFKDAKEHLREPMFEARVSATQYYDQVNEIFSFYKDKEGENIDTPIQIIMQMALMMTFDLDHGHFLESDHGTVIPTILELPEDVRINLKHWKNRTGQVQLDEQAMEDTYQKLKLCFQLVRKDRDAVEKGTGIVRSMAVMAGPNRWLINPLSSIFSPLVSNVIIKTNSFSMQVPGRLPPIDSNAASRQTMFSTAKSLVYQDNPTFGITLDNEPGDPHFYLSARLKSKTENDQLIKERFEANMEKILSFLKEIKRRKQNKK